VTAPGLDLAAIRQVEAVVGLIQRVLGTDALAVYLFGSAVRGGLRADSDLDLLVVAARRTTDAERQTLIEGLLERSRSREHAGDRRHLEVTVVAAADVRPWRYPPPMELQYGDWWRAEYAAGEYAPWTSPNPDLAVLLTSVRDEGVPLSGPPPAELLDPVPPSRPGPGVA
jgi:streptomycin 3"-adenylyltransferase